MATQQQFEYFKFKYKEEDERNEFLIKRSELYMSLPALIFTGLIFELSDIKCYCSGSCLTTILFCSLLVSLVITIVFILLAIRLRDYQQDLDVGEYVEELGNSAPTDEEFFNNRIAMFIVATKNNFAINNAKAANLKKSTYFLMIDFFLMSLFIITIIF